MKLILLQEIASQLEDLKKANLFGLKNNHALIISSLQERESLQKCGVFDFEDEESLITIKDGKLFSKDADIEIINYKTDFHKRNHGIIDESILQERTVTIIGLGSGGGQTAIDLLRCGVVNLILIDPDTVSISNLCRSVYDLADVGRKKTEALLEKLLRINPCANITLYDEDILKMPSDELNTIIEQSDLIFEATDSPRTKLLVNGLCRDNTPVIYPSIYKMGIGGDIFYSLPNFPCWECVFKSSLDEMMKQEKGAWDYSTDQAKPMPGLISDIAIVIARSVKIGLALLTGDQEDSIIEKITEPGCSLLVITNERNCYEGFNMPFNEVWAETKINPECSCQTLS